ncbi:hypothetical protein [Reyranella sp.]|jgi:hypothetical protein|uniref:hypothetical protein n=1 Tax=Reyranella sp. TaxID=1929291 RepID=UPI000BCBDE69|nr:hypothetical protein [Reyranella sp.]OYY34638.1 MAG: hypothetical protein B7Y57_27645 [Rhodospirillales bacterium 35-66-84]OYZ91067.1 MAG: hypothetical protein B7Y08_27550 [Rhodospirillales bacterium 24-66-33]OZB21559.1 MAG: hypothetical protein B7X63_26645 [Rhodospirillales bacterium 39-66-50]HQS19113.1 hypothetical protein [Reyranella sp.]HQT15323.1 hypothetical protein [Reyranella sp.]
MTEAERRRRESGDPERKATHVRRGRRVGPPPESSVDSPAETMERKLDSALSDSFPGSDAVSFLEPAPNKPANAR